MSMIVRLIVVEIKLLLTVTDLSTTCALVIFRVKVSCITSVNGIKVAIDLINHLCRDVIGRL